MSCTAEALTPLFFLGTELYLAGVKHPALYISKQHVPVSEHINETQ
jgi:hypothetical protein